MRSILLILLLPLFLAACGGQPLRPGEASRDQVIATWGTPTARFPEADGGERLLYATAPLGFVTRVLVFAPDGKLRSLHNALVEEEFAKVKAGEDGKAEILHRFGPPTWVQFFEWRNELVWEWRYCDVWAMPARFNVLFDGTTGIVRSTLTVREDTWRLPSYCSR